MLLIISVICIFVNIKHPQKKSGQAMIDLKRTSVCRSTTVRRHKSMII
jgi:hypothetical protein